MKGGVGTNLFVLESLARLGLRLRGELIFETVVDEEFGGVNGTLAGRLQGFNAYSAIISEFPSLRSSAYVPPSEADVPSISPFMLSVASWIEARPRRVWWIN